MADTTQKQSPTPPDALPAVPTDDWKPTLDTVHMWTQIVGKIRMALTPPVNHWWHTTLYVTARGLGTSPIPYRHQTFEIDFDFIAHELHIRTSEGAARTIPLVARPLADFYRDTMAALRDLGIEVSIWPVAVEVMEPISFEEATTHATYNPDHANRFWCILAWSDSVFKEFRGRFLGKSSPSHLFWGGLDLAVTRFSGREAPPHPGVAIMPDFITREAYSHEVSSAGFFAGGGSIGPAFYAYPEPEGFKEAPARPAEAFYSTDMGEFILLYEDVRAAADPEQALLGFLQSSYEAAADLAHWDRAALER